MFERGYWTVFRHRGVPVRLHWTLPVGALVFGGLSPVFWIAFVALIVLHEAGHALLVQRFGHRVQAIDVTGFGGLCRWSGYASERDRTIIAWGGVGAQGLLLTVALAVVIVTGWPSSYIGRELAQVAIVTNAILIALNLLPVAPFDGAQAWRVLRRPKGHRLHVNGGARTAPRRRPAESWRYPR